MQTDSRPEVSGFLHAARQGKGENMRKEKEERLDMLCSCNSPDPNRFKIKSVGRKPGHADGCLFRSKA